MSYEDRAFIVAAIEIKTKKDKKAMKEAKRKAK